MYHDNKLLVNVRVYRETTCIIPVCMVSKSIYFTIMIVLDGLYICMYTYYTCYTYIY